MQSRYFEDIIKNAKRRRNRKRLLALLSAVVVFVTSHSLVSPVSAADWDTPGGPIRETEWAEDVAEVASLDAEEAYDEIEFDLPAAPQEETPQAVEVIVKGDATSARLRDFIDGAELVDATWTVDPEAAYILRLHFTERGDLGFDPVELYYTLPQGITALAEEGYTHGVDGLYEVANGRELTVYCAFDADDHAFSLDVPVRFEAEGAYSFGDDLTREVAFAAEPPEEEPEKETEAEPVEEIAESDEEEAPAEETIEEEEEEQAKEEVPKEEEITEGEEKEQPEEIIPEEEKEEQVEEEISEEEIIEEEEPPVEETIEEEKEELPEEEISEEEKDEQPEEENTEEEKEELAEEEITEEETIEEEKEELPEEEIVEEEKEESSEEENIEEEKEENTEEEQEEKEEAPAQPEADETEEIEAVQKIEETEAAEEIEEVEEAEEPEEVEEPEETEEAPADDADAPVIERRTAEIDLTDAVAPFSLRAWLEAAEALPETPADAWALEYDADILSIALEGEDYIITPLDAFEREVIAVDTGAAICVLTLLDYAPEAAFEPLSGEITVPVTGADYTLSIRVPEAAGLPAGATFVATAIEDETYSAAALGDTDGQVLALFDLTFYDGETVLLPDAALEVSVNLAVEPDMALYAVHFPGTGDQPEEVKAPEIPETPEDIPADTLDVQNEDGLVSFTAESFSYYAIVGYTVDFHWDVDGLTFDYSIDGGGYITLTQLVAALGISDDAQALVKSVDHVTFSNDALVAVSPVQQDTTVGALKDALGLVCEYSATLTPEAIAQIDASPLTAGDWALISLKPFTSDETLTVWMKDGESFVVKVTDAATNAYYYVNSAIMGNIYASYNSTNGLQTSLATEGGKKHIINNMFFGYEDGYEFVKVVFGDKTFLNSSWSYGTQVYRRMHNADAGVSDLWNNAEENVIIKAYYQPKESNCYIISYKSAVYSSESSEYSFNDANAGSNNTTDTILISKSDGIGLNTDTLEIKDTLSVSASPKGTGNYKFIGWYIRPTGSEDTPASLGKTDVATILSLSEIYNKGWSGAEIIAVYEEQEPEYTVTYTITDATYGSVVVKGTDSDTTEIVKNSTEAKGAIATANRGYAFEAWIDADGTRISTNPEFVPDVSKLSADVTYTAIFNKLEEIVITYKVGDNNPGYVYLVGGQDERNSSITEILYPGETPSGAVVVKTGNDEEYHFVGWTDENNRVVTLDNTFTPTGDQIRTATYTANIPKAKRVYLTVNDITWGSIQRDGDQTNKLIGYDVINGNINIKYTYKATPTNRDYQFDHWELNGVVIPFNNSDIKEVGAAPDDSLSVQILKAVFRPVRAKKITYEATNGGTVDNLYDFIANDLAAKGSTAKPEENYRFDIDGSGWYCGKTFITHEQTVTEEHIRAALGDITKDITLTAKFVPDPVMPFTVSVGPKSSYGNVVYHAGGRDLPYVGDQETTLEGQLPFPITAVPSEGAQFVKWTLDDEEISNSAMLNPEDVTFTKREGSELVAEFAATNPITINYQLYNPGNYTDDDHAPTLSPPSETIISASDPAAGCKVTTDKKYWVFSGWLVEDPSTKKAKSIRGSGDANMTFVPTETEISDNLVTSSEGKRFVTFYALFRPGNRGLVSYNTNLSGVNVSWGGVKDVVWNTGAGGVAFGDSNGGKYYGLKDSGDNYMTFIVSNEEPEADGYKFIGWFDKARGTEIEKVNKDLAAENKLNAPAQDKAALRKAGDELYFIYAGTGGQRYTLEALWLKLDASDAIYPYDDKVERVIEGTASIEAGTLMTPADGEEDYRQAVTDVLTTAGYQYDKEINKFKGVTVQYKLLRKDGEAVDEDYTYSFAETKPGKYEVEVKATVALTGKDSFTLTKIVTLTILPKTVKVIKVWDDQNDQYEKRPEKADFSVTLKQGETAVTKVDWEKDVKDNNVWVATYTGLPFMSNGALIEYSVVEPNVPGYSSTIASPEKSIAYPAIWKDENYDNETFVVTNHFNMVNFTVRKVDMDRPDTLLAGAEFKITRKNDSGIMATYGGVEGVYTVDASGATRGAFTVKLPDGEYVLQEIKAPDGYNISASPLAFTVENEKIKITEYDSQYFVITQAEGSNNITVTVKNLIGFTLPATGGPGTAGYTASGLALILLACFLLLRRRRA